MRDRLPAHSELLIPLLRAINTNGGVAKPGELYDQLAAEFGLTDELRNSTVVNGDRKCNAFERRVRWTRQTAVCKGLLAKETRGVWQLTDHGNVALRNARRGTILTVFETDNGIALWANGEDAIGIIERESIDLIFTSPPYALTRSKNYGNLPPREWVDWMLRLCEGWRELLTPTGSMMINVGPVWNPGMPTQNTYIERLLIALEDSLGLHLLQRLYWSNPTKLPQPREWVAVRRVRVKPSIEPILWMSPNPNAKANNRNVLVPYSESMKRDMKKARGIERRPSGFDVDGRSFARDNGGAIPPDVLRISNGSSNDRYHREARAKGLPMHPATFPPAMAEFGIKLATDPGDTVLDPFFGSGTVGEVCERLNRRWIGIERSLTFLEGARLRFPAARLVA